MRLYCIKKYFGDIMDRLHYEEMIMNLNILIQEHVIQDKRIFLFGHCNATEELADILLEKKLAIAAILDNNSAKHGSDYRGITIQPPQSILSEAPEKTLVCIVARAYAAMADQLKRMDYKGQIRKLVDYNSYAEYSLSSDVVLRKKQRMERGIILLQQLERKYYGYFRILCPFAALGDIYYMMSYLPYFLQKRKIEKYVVAVIGNACADVVRLFGGNEVEVFSQKEMDEAIQAALYIEDANTYIPHQDRPYIVNLHKALYRKFISLDQIYCCGVFGLPASTPAHVPAYIREYGEKERIKQGRAVILSPHAKSVTALPGAVWQQVVRYYLDKGFQCFTNVAGNELALPETEPISPKINEIQSLVEWAGTFIGIRSGICDVIRGANCRKVALYPDYNYCDTRWKAIDMYDMEGWEQIVVKEGFQWRTD